MQHADERFLGWHTESRIRREVFLTLWINIDAVVGRRGPRRCESHRSSRRRRSGLFSVSTVVVAGSWQRSRSYAAHPSIQEMEHDRGEAEADRHGGDANDPDHHDANDNGTHADETDRSDIADGSMVLPEAQERDRPGGPDLNDHSHGTIRVSLACNLKRYVEYAYVVLQDLDKRVEAIAPSVDLLIRERNRRATLDRRADATDGLNGARDVMDEHGAPLPSDLSPHPPLGTAGRSLQPGLDEVAVALNRLSVVDGHPSCPRQEAAQHEGEDGAERGHPSAAAAPPSPTHEQLLSSYHTAKDDIEACRTRIVDAEQRIAADGVRYQRELGRWLVPLEMLDIITERHEAGIRAIRQDVDRIQQDVGAVVRQHAGWIGARDEIPPAWTAALVAHQGSVDARFQQDSEKSTAVQEEWTGKFDEHKRLVDARFEQGSEKLTDMRDEWTGKLNENTRGMTSRVDHVSGWLDHAREEWITDFNEHTRDVTRRVDHIDLRLDHTHDEWTRLAEHTRHLDGRVRDAFARLENTEAAWARTSAEHTRAVDGRLAQQGRENAAQFGSILAMLNAESGSGLAVAVQRAHRLCQADMNGLRSLLDDVCSGRVESGLSRGILAVMATINAADERLSKDIGAVDERLRRMADAMESRQRVLDHWADQGETYSVSDDESTVDRGDEGGSRPHPMEGVIPSRPTSITPTRAARHRARPAVGPRSWGTAAAGTCSRAVGAPSWRPAGRARRKTR